MNLRLGLPQALAVSLFAHAALVAPWPGMAPDVASEVVRVQPITVRLARAPQAPPAPEQREQALPPASTGEAPAPQQHPAQIAGDSAAPAATPAGTPQRARRSELAANELPDNILIDTGLIELIREEYLGVLREHARRHIAYPEAARAAGIEGELLVTFSLDRRGNVLDARLDKRSGHPELDDAVLQAVRDVAPWPGPPLGLPFPEVEVELWLPFRLE